MSQLLVEYNSFNVDRSAVAKSLSADPNTLIVSGVLQRANSKNQNGRIYRKPILEREIQKYTENEIAQRRALGELDHSPDPTVNLKNVSHNILECWWDGDELYGKVEILNTPAGNILKELFKAGITLGISSRGMGSVKCMSENDDTMEVQSDFSLITFDFVSNPSVRGAFMQPVTEGVSTTTKRVMDTNIDDIIRDIICEMSGVCCLN